VEDINMRHWRWFLLVAFGLALIPGVLAQQAEKSTPPEGFTPLFNGKDLTGWKVNEGGKMDAWGVDKGLLYVKGGGGGWLMTEKEYGDFEVQLDFRMTRGGNSGVALRSPMKGDPAYVGMEIQLLDDEGHKGLQPWQHTGSIYGVVPPTKDGRGGPDAKAMVVTRPPGEWNHIHIVARGKQIKVEVNGTKLVDANLDDYLEKHAKRHPGLLRTTGHVGLQSHSNRVEFRNIYIKPL
jgi:hypothetical protein